MLFLSQIVTWTATFVLMAALARGLGDDGFGQLFLAMSFAVIFSVFVDFGLDQYLVRTVARNHDLAPQYLLSAVIVKIVTAAAAYLSVVGVIQLLDYTPEARLVISVFCLILLVNGVSSTINAVFQALESLIHPAIGSILEKVCVAGVALAALSQGYGVVVIAAIYVGGAIVSVIWKLSFLRRKIAFTSNASIATMRVLVAGGVPFFLYSSLASIYYRIDAVILSILTEVSVVGWYAAAYRLFDTLGFLPAIMSAVMFPVLSRLSSESLTEFHAAVTRSINVVLAAGVPICAGLFILADPIIELIYGRPEFLNGTTALRWLALALLVLYINSVMGVSLMSLHKERKLAYIAIVAIVVNTGLNWIFIPMYQHNAAAATTLVTEILIFGYFVCVMPDRGFLLRSLGTLIRVTAATAVMVASVVVLLDQNLLLIIPIGALVYGIGALALRVVRPSDFAVITQLVQSRRANG
jgi:O-antigen/teichoic acid export membrane protein